MFARGTCKGKRVYVQVDADGGPLLDAKGCWVFRYKNLDGQRMYSGLAVNMTLESESASPLPLRQPPSSALAPPAPRAPHSSPSPQATAKPATNTTLVDSSKALVASLDPGAIVFYTDGACLGNPGPAGAGVLMLYPNGCAPPSERHVALGYSTNNIAELSAVAMALDMLDEYDSGLLYTDTDEEDDSHSNTAGALAKRARVEDSEASNGDQKDKTMCAPGCAGCGRPLSRLCNDCHASSSSSSSSTLRPNQTPSDQHVTRRTPPVEILTDSKYVQGVLTLGWKAKANVELVDRIRTQLATCGYTVRIHWIKAHVGIAGNERADRLANRGVDESKAMRTLGPSLGKRKADVLL